MTLETVKKMGLAILLMFLLISFWSNPAGSAVAFGDFVADVGGFFSTVISKAAQFVKSLSS